MHKKILLNKIKIIQYYNTQRLNLNMKWSKFSILTTISHLKFLWRSKFTYNLLLIYYYIINNVNTAKAASLLLNYLALQFRILFSKYEQKLFLYLILNFNKLFIKNVNITKLNYFNNLILLQLIITGRWQRKRWVTPFPKTYISSSLNFNKIYKKLYKYHYRLSYAQKSIWTRKGIIGLRVFLIYNRK